MKRFFLNYALALLGFGLAALALPARAGLPQPMCIFYGQARDGYGLPYRADADVILLRGTPRDGELRLPPVADLRAMKEGIFRIWDSYDYGIRSRFRSRILKNYQQLAFETSLAVLETRRQQPRCLAGSRHLVVLASGDVAFCELGKPIGNLLQDDLQSILHSEAARRQRDRIASGGCFCHHNCNLMDNFFLSPLQAGRLLLRRGG